MSAAGGKGSVYEAGDAEVAPESHTIGAPVDHEAGVLARGASRRCGGG